MVTRGFAPIARGDAITLVLGTLPGTESVRKREYYAARGNAFWLVMGHIFDAGWNLAYQSRIEKLMDGRVAVWDVLAEALRAGSSDGAIRRGSEIPNDLDSFLRAHSSISRIVFNGGGPSEYFRKLVVPSLSKSLRNLPQLVLPSTSGANTHLTNHEKLERWRSIRHAACQE